MKYNHLVVVLIGHTEVTLLCRNCWLVNNTLQFLLVPTSGASEITKRVLSTVEFLFFPQNVVPLTKFLELLLLQESLFVSRQLKADYLKVKRVPMSS